MLANSDIFEQARQTRDARFDGRFFVGVLTTGIYCRPICPVKIPLQKNIQLYETAAAAAQAGFRPCLRCRPEASPGTATFQGGPAKVGKALQLINQGLLNHSSISDLAKQLNLGPRQLSRLFLQHLGASPVAVAQTQRLHLAKQLIDTSRLTMTQVCFAAGFSSVRRFNSVFKKTYGLSPSQLRVKSSRAKSPNSDSLTPAKNEIVIKLSYRPPFDWQAMLKFLAFRAIPGVELVTADSYARTITLGEKVGEFKLCFDKGANHLLAKIQFPDSRYLYLIIEKIRLMFDLRADSSEIDRFLATDKLLAASIKAFPGTRIPGCWDGFEVSVRAILGQQVSVKSATTLTKRVASQHGLNYDGSDQGLNKIFPSPAQLAQANLNGLGIVSKRIEAIKQVAQAVLAQQLRFDGSMQAEQFIEKICQIKGIGPWTAHYIALRALQDPNAFPHADLILLRAAGSKDKPLTPRQLLKLAEPWQPWRAYTVLLLWRSYQANKP